MKNDDPFVPTTSSHTHTTSSLFSFSAYWRGHQKRSAGVSIIIGGISTAALATFVSTLMAAVGRWFMRS